MVLYIYTYTYSKKAEDESYTVEQVHISPRTDRGEDGTKSAEEHTYAPYTLSTISQSEPTALKKLQNSNNINNLH